MYEIVETISKAGHSVYTLYKNTKAIKDTFNLEVIKALLGRRFKRVFEKRIVKRA